MITLPDFKNRDVYLDTETVGLYGDIRLLQTCICKADQLYGDTIVFDFFEMSVDEIDKLFKRLKSARKIIGHNLLYDWHCIKPYGHMPAEYTWEDTFFLSRLRFPELRKYTLDNVMTHVLNYDPYEKYGLEKSKLQKFKWGGDLTEAAITYAKIDVAYLPFVYHAVKDAENEFSYRLDKITAEHFVECRGVLPFDEKRLLSRRFDNLEKINEIGLEINSNSWQQVRHYLNSEESDDAALAKMLVSGDETIAARALKVRETRRLRKQNSTIVSYLKQIDDDGYIRGRLGLSPISGRSSCIRKGVKILCDGVEKPIEEIRRGDYVWCYDEHMRPTLKKVLNVYHNGKREIIRLHWLSQGARKRGYLDCTEDHKIRLVTGKYVPARNCVGERVASIDERTKSANKLIIDGEYLNIVDDVYDLEVEDYHNFIANEICVHNCSNENLQQVPSALKDCVRSDREYMVYADFSNLELRTFAAVVGERTMAELLISGVDLHRYTAAIIFDKEMDDVTKRERQIAKVLNFSSLYAAGWTKKQAILLKWTGIWIPDNEMQVLHYKWFQAYPDVYPWHVKNAKLWRAGKYTSTPLGRRVSPKLLTDFCNIQIQGAGAEIAKLALHYMAKRLGMDDLGMFVHDSYTWLTSDLDRAKHIADVMAESMQQAWREYTPHFVIKDIPMPVEAYVADIGTDWKQLQDGEGVIYEKILE